MKVKNLKKKNNSYPVGSDPGLPYLPFVITEVATGKEMIIRNSDTYQAGNISGTFHPVKSYKGGY